MRAGIVVNVTRADRLRLEAIVADRSAPQKPPTAYGFRDVLVKGFVDEVAIICGASEIARHPRVYGRGQFVFDPKHYLALVRRRRQVFCRFKFLVGNLS
jgi:hypothetical protein